MHHSRSITALAIRAAREAGQIALEGFRSQSLRIDHKSSFRDYVTQFDRACEAHIRAVVAAEQPDSSFVGEEGGESAGGGSLTWFVDPIDGTSNYARGIALWAVSIGVARDGEMIAGVIFDPVAQQLFWADARGAFLVEGAPEAHPGRELDDASRPLRSTGNIDPHAATVVMNFPLAHDLVHEPELALAQFAEVTREFAQVRGLGSTCITLAWIAAGWVDATVSFGTHAWDIAAGAFIVRQAGGVFAGYAAGYPLPESRDYEAPHYFAAVRGGEFAVLREIMRTQSVHPR